MLLGLIAAHLDDFIEAETTGDIAGYGTVRAPVDTGVGIVVPVEAIRETLNAKELVEFREQREKRVKERPVEAATADWANVPPGEDGLANA